MGTATYVGNAELPDLTYAWVHPNTGVLFADMATGWTFQLTVKDGASTLITKSAGITGAATDPNVTVAWAAGERDSLTRGRSYTLELTATRTADTKRRRRVDTLRIL